MADSAKESVEENRAAGELICSDCGKRFIFGRNEQERFAQMGWQPPKRCPACRKNTKERRKEAAERIENEAWQKKKAEDQKKFDALLKNWPVVQIDELRSENDRVLYILGNGFDLMHGIKSSYYAFRDSLGKNSNLRQTLEFYLTPDDIWADFESALAHFNVSSMGSLSVVDDMLDLMDAYQEDAGAAEYFMAIEAAATPIQIVSQELPRRFRMWVGSLSIGTRDRPLKKMFRKGQVLCFNYTEFVETLYGIPKQNVCYIHGCRRKIKGRPYERLILGHTPGESEDAFDFDDDFRIKDPYKRAMSQTAQDQVLQLIADYDEDLTKDCREIIARHAAFFSGLKEIETVITVGHSFSPVDWDYFAKVAAELSDKNSARWYFGCHCLRDLENLERLLKRLDMDRSNVCVFRTDAIRVTPMKNEDTRDPAENSPRERTMAVSPNGGWAAKTRRNQLSIVDRERQTVEYEVQFSYSISHAFFLRSESRLVVLIRGVDPGVFLFHLEDARWRFVNELESIRNQGVLNPRLRHVFLTDRELTFVYNSRVRKYSLSDGSLTANQARRNAGSYSYEGEDVTDLFLRRQ